MAQGFNSDIQCCDDIGYGRSKDKRFCVNSRCLRYEVSCEESLVKLRGFIVKSHYFRYNVLCEAPLLQI